jgi:hypothetical protein
MTTKEQVLEIIKQVQAKPTFSNDAITRLYDLVNRIETEVTEPQVKQLVWANSSAIAFKYGTEYPIRYDIDKYGKTVFLKFNDNIVTKTDSLKRAKAYAQQHFEGLIKSCLEGE